MQRIIIWLLKPLCGLLVALGLGGCDAISLRELQPGVSTAVDVRAHFGAPGMEWRNDDGSVTWEYTRQPQGIECFMITIGPDQVLRAIVQVLDEAHFARVQRGMVADEIRRLLGKPGSEQYFALSRETVWNWRIAAQLPGNPEFFSVHFNDEGRVVRTSRSTEYRG